MIKIEIKIELTEKKSSSEVKTLVQHSVAAFDTFAESWQNFSFLNFIVWLSHPKPRVPAKKLHSLQLINSLIVYMKLISPAVGRLQPGRRSRRTLQPCALAPPRHTLSLSSTHRHAQLPSTCTQSGGKQTRHPSDTAVDSC